MSDRLTNSVAEAMLLAVRLEGVKAGLRAASAACEPTIVESDGSAYQDGREAGLAAAVERIRSLNADEICASRGDQETMQATQGNYVVFGLIVARIERSVAGNVLELATERGDHRAALTNILPDCVPGDRFRLELRPEGK